MLSLEKSSLVAVVRDLDEDTEAKVEPREGF